jgi:Family of unknown function (DUF6152)
MRTHLVFPLLIAPLFATTALAHHGWSSYDADKTLTLTGTIDTSGYEHPHGFVKLKTPDKLWHAVLAPPSRMENRSLTNDMLKPGTKATVVGYPHRSETGELRVERITIDGKTVELR